MGKSLLSESVEEKLKKLNRNISYNVGNKKINIEVSRVKENSSFEYSGKNYSSYTIFVNGEKFLEKQFGYTHGGAHSFNYEIFNFQDVQIKNNLKELSQDSEYVKENLWIDDNILNINGERYKMSEDSVICGSVYFIPSTKEIGLLIDDGIKKVIKKPYEDTDKKIREIFDYYSSNSNELRKSVLEKIKKSISEKQIIYVSEIEYKELEERINKVLGFKMSESTIKEYSRKINKIEKMYSLYLDVEKHKQILLGEISEFNTVLESCLNKTISDEEAYKKELEKVQKSLKKKYNIQS